jgi:LmbE family N-acetylglucosaminyl deacetylase
LSPHPDDAVFSAWHVVSSPADVRVVTVFAAIPEAGLLTPLDRAGGATGSAERFRERLEDDRDALGLAGREPTHVPLPDVQYRAERNPTLRAGIERDPTQFISLVAADPTVHMSPQELRPELGRFVDGDVVVYAPAGIGGHPDHRDVARFGFQLASEGRRVRLYGDTPYFMRHGLPSWLTGVENAAADAHVHDGLAILSPDAQFDRHLIELEQAQVEAKLASARRYETEFEPANADFGGVLAEKAAMRFEVYWTVGPEP